jgi:hypothetical protein
MKPYTFYTINTIVDIGDGSTPAIIDGKFTGAMNLTRIIQSVMDYDYPMMVSIVKNEVDLSKGNNSDFYNLPPSWGKCIVSTLKFALPVDVHIQLTGIPLVLPTVVNKTRITRFNLAYSTRNTSITKQTFGMGK